MWSIAQADLKTQFWLFEGGWALPTTWVVVIGWSANLVSYGADQTVVQRYLTTKDEKDAARGIWVNGLLAIPGTVLFFLVGTALYVFYKQHPTALHPAINTDAIFPWFVVRQLPAGVAGLVIAGVFAASMSSLDSSMNSVATTLTNDYVRRFHGRLEGAAELRMARIFTLVLGVVGTGSAVFMARSDIHSLWDQYLAVIGLFGGGLAGLFVLGIFTRRANGTGVLVGFLVSALVVYGVKIHGGFHPFLYAPIGTFSCVALGYALSLPFSDTSKRVDGLTFHDLRKEEA
jgi:Na+/proline symporter